MWLLVGVGACGAPSSDDHFGEGQVGLFQPAQCGDPTQGCAPELSCQASLDLTYAGYCTKRCQSDADCPSGSTCEGKQCWLSCAPLPKDTCPQGFFCGLEVDGVGANGVAAPVLTCFAKQPNKAYSGLLCTSAFVCPAGQTCRPYPYPPCAPGDVSCFIRFANWGANGAACACSPGPPNVKCESWCRVGGSDCPTGTTCAGFDSPVRADGVEIGTCRTDCDPAGSGCPLGTTCIVETSGGKPATDCEWTCDLTDQPTCGPNAECVPVVDGTAPAHTTCKFDPCQNTSVGTDDNGDPIVACEPAPSDVAWCKIGPNGGCTSGTSCKPASPPLVIGGVTFGTCG